MKCFIIIDAQNDFLPNGAFNSKEKFMNVIDKINSIRLKIYNCAPQKLIKLKHCLQASKNKHTSANRNFEEYYKCPYDIDDEKSLHDILVFPFDHKCAHFNEYNTYTKKIEENIGKESNSYNTIFENKMVNKLNDNSDLNVDKDPLNGQLIDLSNSLKEKFDAYNFALSILSIDYHPQFHISFAETHKTIYKQIYNNNLKTIEIKDSEKLLLCKKNTSKGANENTFMDNLYRLDYNFLKNNKINNLVDVWENIKSIKQTKTIYKNVNSINDIKNFTQIDFLNQKIDLWPVHCVQNTYGCKIHKKLIRNFNDIIIKKGQNQNKESYTIFENEESTNNILKILKEKNIKFVYICGFVLEYCVKETVLDFLKYDFETFIIEDATACLYECDEEKISLKKKGVKFINSRNIFT